MGSTRSARDTFYVSFLLNCTALGLLIWVTTWTASHVPEVKKVIGLSVDISPYVLPAVAGPFRWRRWWRLARHQARLQGRAAQVCQDPDRAAHGASDGAAQIAGDAHGGGAAGDQAAADPGSWAIRMSKVIGTLSNGPGLGGGIGSGTGGGVGSGSGPGVGPGHGGGIGGGAYHVGGGVLAPKIISRVEPEFSEEARKNKWQGVVILRLIIGTDGKPHDITVQRSLGMGLDEKAKEAVQQWRFEPGTKDGQPVPVEVSMEVSFRLY